jgi:predicted GNAT family acetyltransferase
VDAKNDVAARFYQRYGFTPSADQPLKLFLSLW